MKNVCIGVLVAVSLGIPAASQAQIVATERAAFGFVPNYSPAPNNPGGGVVIGNNVWATDAVWGLRHYIPADPANPDPVNSGILIFDNANDGTSTVSGGLCIPFCEAGQVAYDGNQTIYVALKDQPKGQPFSLNHPGVYRFVIDPVTGQFPGLGTLLVPNAGLAGNLPTAVALGPDGDVYVGFEKNGNVVRIVNPLVDPNNDPNKTQIVQSVGTSPNGRPIRGLAFRGPDLYVASSDSLSFIKNAVANTCLGGCNAVAIQDGLMGQDHVGITSDGINRLYLCINGQGVFRFTISPQATQQISTGGADAITGAVLPFAFVGGHSNLLQLDRLGNLWIGDDISDGRLNFNGRIWYISAGALSSIP